MRTGFLTASISRNGGGLHESVRRLAQATNKVSSNNVVVLGVQDEFTDADIGSWAPVPIQTFPVYGPERFSYAPSLKEALFEAQLKILHSHGLWRYTSIAAYALHRRTGIPYVVHPHGMLDPWAVGNARLKKMIANFLYEAAHLKKAACIRALCQSEAQAIRSYGLRNPIAIIPNGIDLPENDRQEAEIANPPWHGIVDPDKKILLFLSRIHPKKGLVNLLRAWAQIQKSEEWVLAIAGWDEKGHEAELKLIASDLGLDWADAGNQNTKDGSQCSVVFVGPQFNKRKATCYQKCDAFILPSFSEGVPMVVLEAWAYGKPVLITPQCNLPEGFAANAAVRIEPSINSIVAGLNEFMCLSNSGRRSLGSNGLDLVRQRFTWDIVGSQLADLSTWLANGSSRPRFVME